MISRLNLDALENGIIQQTVSSIAKYYWLSDIDIDIAIPEFFSKDLISADRIPID